MRLTALVVFLLACAVLPAAAQGRIPEKLTYDLSWTGIPIGSASQSIVAEGDMVKISAVFRSNAWLNSFYPVENLIETTLSRKPGLFPGEVRQFRMRFREGARVRDRSIRFDHVSGKGFYKDFLTGEEAVAAIRSNSSDVTSAFYHARHLPIKAGQTLFLPVMDGREPYLLEVKILGSEMLSTILGRVETLIVQPLVRPEGTFEGKRGIKLWITNDQRRIPVKLRTGVTLGSVTATLSGME